MKKLNIMEVCGTHTMAIARHGLKKIFPPYINMLSGPGCPVCVTPTEDIDRAIETGRRKDVIITTFGDMFTVPGSKSSLAKEHSSGMDARIVYSPADALDIAKANRDKSVVFLGVGFETTSPTIAATVLIAKRMKIKNFSVLPMFKTIPNALRAILDIKERKIDGFLLPGHVSTIIGSKPYEEICEKYGVPGVVAGFEAQDVLKSINILTNQIKNRKPMVSIQYTRLVKREGNKTAQNVLSKVFKEVDSNWRGIGVIPKSGLTFSDKYKDFDASKRFKISVPKPKEPKGCLCGSILLGLKSPKQCRLFGRACTPADPIGPCMVSSEGSCAAEYKYG